MHRIRSVLTIVIFAAAATVAAAGTDGDPVARHSRRLVVSADGLSGPGLDLILAAAADARFVAIGENHATAQIPALVGQLFAVLHDKAGFRYLAVENGPVAMALLSEETRRGRLDRTLEFGRQRPMAIQFNFREELDLLATVGRTSNAEYDPVWGLDNATGAGHLLELLAAEVADDAGRRLVRDLEAQAAAVESTRFAQGPEQAMWIGTEAGRTAVVGLRASVKPRPGSRADDLLAQLELAAEIYDLHFRGVRGEIPGSFANNSLRERNLKVNFLRHLRAAERAGDEAPRVMVKLGSNHVIRGLSPTRQQSLGAFLTEAAMAEGTSCLHLLMIGVAEEGPFAEAGAMIEPFMTAADPDGITVVDLRPLQHLAYAGKLGDLADDHADVLYGYDLLVVVGGAGLATFDLGPATGDDG